VLWVALQQQQQQQQQQEQEGGVKSLLCWGLTAAAAGRSGGLLGANFHDGQVAVWNMVSFEEDPAAGCSCWLAT
jgi:hypothetical protein